MSILIEMQPALANFHVNSSKFWEPVFHYLQNLASSRHNHLFVDSYTARVPLSNPLQDYKICWNALSVLKTTSTGMRDFSQLKRL